MSAYTPTLFITAQDRAYQNFLITGKTLFVGFALFPVVRAVSLRSRKPPLAERTLCGSYQGTVAFSILYNSGSAGCPLGHSGNGGLKRCYDRASLVTARPVNVSEELLDEKRFVDDIYAMTEREHRPPRQGFITRTALPRCIWAICCGGTSRTPPTES